MANRILLGLVLLLFSASASIAGLVSDDGYLTAGEYEISAWLENNDELIVMGGGHMKLLLGILLRSK